MLNFPVLNSRFSVFRLTQMMCFKSLLLEKPRERVVCALHKYSTCRFVMQVGGRRGGGGTREGKTRSEKCMFCCYMSVLVLWGGGGGQGWRNLCQFY